MTWRRTLSDEGRIQAIGLNGVYAYGLLVGNEAIDGGCCEDAG